ncbi:MAG: AraC family transcriptional regulator [Bacteroidales bacterium]|jgi:AraC-like DNA-binding protein|nr:AraC family transcriptional regulator [Bacteroidales bacterium]
MVSKEIIKINTVEEFTDLLHIPTIGHPLLNVYCLTGKESDFYIGKPVQLNLYSIALKEGCKGNTKYGWRNYDFSKGLMNFFAPGQIHSWNENSDRSIASGWVLTFHPDFIRKYPLGAKIRKYKFFSYETNEALHISDAERLMIEKLVENIYNECSRNIDEHSQDIIVSQIEVMLSYAERFYTRQFRTRHSVEAGILTRFEVILHEHFAEESNKLISASDIASQLSMSTSYLSDLLRNLTGMNTQQHIHLHLIEKAKNLLQTTNLSINEIAYMLGFEYPQYFNRLFKHKTGQTPLEFRNMN